MYSGTVTTELTIDPAPSSLSAVDIQLPFLPNLPEADGAKLLVRSTLSAIIDTLPVEAEDFIGLAAGLLPVLTVVATPVNSRSVAVRDSNMAILLRTEGTKTHAPRRLCVE